MLLLGSMMKYVLLFVSVITLVAAQVPECTVNVNTDFPSNEPLLLKPNGPKDLNGFYMPDSAGIIHIPSGAQILLACPGTTNKIKSLNLAQTLVTCQSGKTFTRNGINYIMKDFNCNSVVSNTAKKNTTGQCEITGAYSNIDIGFTLSDGSFYSTIKVCFDELNSDTMYSKFIQNPSIAGAEQGDPRPGFVEGSFYPSISANTQYTKDSQRTTYARILGSSSLAAQYISLTTDYYLARGHLAARADFVFDTQQRATFWYINVAPQWQTLNAGNWGQLEDDVRNFTKTSGKNLTIYTGSHGIAKLPDVNNVSKPLYLYLDANNVGKMKVPEVMWKVVYDAQTQKGIAFVGVNNPYLSTYTPLCTNVCNQVQWLKWQPTNQKSGFCYCCDVNVLRSSIPTIPNFTVTGLLF